MQVSGCLHRIQQHAHVDRRSLPAQQLHFVRCYGARQCSPISVQLPNIGVCDACDHPQCEVLKAIGKLGLYLPHFLNYFRASGQRLLDRLVAPAKLRALESTSQ